MVYDDVSFLGVGFYSGSWVHFEADSFPVYSE